MSGNDGNFAKRCALLAPRIVAAMKRRRMEAYYCATAAEAADKALALLPAGATVSWGGSVTLNEIGLLDAVRQRGFTVIDRDAAPDPEGRFERMRQALSCDVYLTSANAVTEDGQLVNVDGFGNRVAAMIFGPRHVIAVVGMNKVCQTLDEAVARARRYAAPVNAVRVGAEKTPCAATGSCADCQSPDCICSYIVTTRMSKVPGRLKVILVGQSLGY